MGSELSWCAEVEPQVLRWCSMRQEATTTGQTDNAMVRTEPRSTELQDWVRSEGLQPTLDRLPASPDVQKAWRELSRVLTPQHPSSLHQSVLQHVAQFWDAKTQGPFPLWYPDATIVQCTNLARFMADFEGGEEWQRRSSGNPTADLPLLQRLSWQQPERFWPPVLARLNLVFHRQPDRMLQMVSRPEDVRWLPGARFNIAECALSGAAERTAVLWAPESAPSSVRRVSLGQLRRRCYAVAAGLHQLGHVPGTAIAIDMPMTLESVVVYLGIILAGCVAVTIADSFAPGEIAARLRIAHCKAIFTQDVALRGGKAHPLFARVAAAGAPPAIVVPANVRRGVQVQVRRDDMSWADFLQRARPAAAGFRPNVADSDDTSCVLFSSGTTGEPKAIVWAHVTPLRCAVDGWAHHDLKPGAVAAWPTNLGWMMGPWLVFASLLNRSAMALFQGAPLGRPFGEFVSAARVTMLGLVPSIVRAWRHSGCMAGLAWEDHLRCYSSTGEASSPDDCQWLMAHTRYRCPILEYCGGTEIGGGYMCGTLLQPQAPSTFSTPTLGAALCLLLPDGSQSPSFAMHRSSGGGSNGGSSAGSSSGGTGNSAQEVSGAVGRPAAGELALAPPMLGTSQRLLNRDHHAVYFEGMPLLAGTQVRLRRHGDEVARLPGGYYQALGRADDTMNLGGIKVASADLERACSAAHEAIADVAAVAIPPPGGGPDRLVVFLALRPGASVGEAQLLRACQAAIRTQLNPLFKVSHIVVRDALPRTASNKLMRRVLRDQGLPREKTPIAKL